MKGTGIKIETEYQVKKGLARQYWEYELNRLDELEEKINNGEISNLPEALTLFFDFFSCEIGDWQMVNGKYFWDELYEAKNKFINAWIKCKGNISEVKEELKG